MYRSLILELDDDSIDYRKSSNLQGVLFENISTEYAEILHEQNLHPYSQYLEKTSDKILWHINTLDDEAGCQIIDTLKKDEFSSFVIKKTNQKINIISKTEHSVNQSDLMKEFYDNESQRYLDLRILTPTSFKQQGRYVIYPDLRLIFQSLMNKFSAVLPDVQMSDEETLEQLVNSSQITRYNLRSCTFPMEGVKIPSFMGRITIKCNGSGTMSNFIRLLLRFGEFSGIGVKTGMGMGAIKIEERGSDNGKQTN